MAEDYLEKAKKAADGSAKAGLIDKAKCSALIAIAQELRLIRQQLGYLLKKEGKDDYVRIGK